MASGCLGLISFPREPGRVTLEQIEERYPRLLAALRDHPGIGFVLVRSEQHGAVVLGAAGVALPRRATGSRARTRWRRSARTPPTTCAHRRLPALPGHRRSTAPTGTDADEVAAFEELVGSHGGMGGGQCFPFVLHPAELDWPDGEVIGAERVHRVFRGWLAGLGQDAYADTDVDSPGSSTRTSTEGATSAT